jgi:hypothetical protein
MRPSPSRILHVPNREHEIHAGFNANNGSVLPRIQVAVQGKDLKNMFHMLYYILKPRATKGHTNQTNDKDLVAKAESAFPSACMTHAKKLGSLAGETALGLGL